MPLPDANKKSPRVYTNLQNLDLDSVTFANIQSTGNPIAVEELNEDEMRRLVLVNLARLVCAGEWQGLLDAGGGASTLGDLTDVLLDGTNFTNGLLIQTNSNGSAPTTGTLDAANNNIAIGADVLKSVTSGADNIIFGEETGQGITTGSKNIVVGIRAMGAAAGGTIGTQSNNVAIGYKAMTGILSGANNNVAIGYQSMKDSSLSGDDNVAVGEEAGSSITSGSRNLCIGVGSGNITTGDSNTIIGYGGGSTATGDKQLEITSGGSVGTVTFILGDSAGSCYQGDNESTWSTTSDRNLKRDIEDATKGLEAINAIQVRKFRYRKNNRYKLDHGPSRVGVIAQELEEVFPEAVKENVHGHKTVSTDSINWALLKAVQELSAKVEALEAVA